MNSGIDTWKRHDIGAKSTDDDLENTLTVGEFDSTLTGLELTDSEINNNSISQWISGKNKDALIGAPLVPLSFSRNHHPPHTRTISSCSTTSSSTCISIQNHHQHQQHSQQLQPTYPPFLSPIVSQPIQLQPSHHQRPESGNFSDWSNFMTSINLGQQFYETQYQYILSAATTPCTKLNEETLTYLNQGQSYELKLKKIGDAIQIEGQYLKSVVRVIFHERRLQYMEREQLELWKQTRPGERILDIDIPLSYGLLDVKIDPQQLSCIEFTWDPRRDSGMYIKINAISTEFTPRRHGGEKGVPFRIQVETYTFNNDSCESERIIHCASCQVKVFKPKGADRKYKTDRDKIEKKSETEREKYQPAFECTVLNEIPLEQVKNYLEQLNCKPEQESGSTISVLPQQQITTTTSVMVSPSRIASFDPICFPSATEEMSGSFQSLASNSEIPCRFGGTHFVTGAVSMSQMPSSTENVVLNHSKDAPSPVNQSLTCDLSLNQSLSESTSSSSVSFASKCLISPATDTISRSSLTVIPSSPLQGLQLKSTDKHQNLSLLSDQLDVKQVEFTMDQILPDSTADFVVRWLISQRFSNFIKLFQHFSGADLLRLSREDLIEICGLPDGIRLNNALRSKIIRPRLLIYVYQENQMRRGSVRDYSTSTSTSNINRGLFSNSTTSPSPHCPSPPSTVSPSSTQSTIDTISSTLSPYPSVATSPDSARRARSRSSQLLMPTNVKRTSDYECDYECNDPESDCCNDSTLSKPQKMSRHYREISRKEGCFAIYLECLTAAHLADKLATLYRIESNQICDILYEGPTSVRVLVTDSVVQNFTDHSKYGIETYQDEDHVGLYHVLLRHSTR